MPHSLQVRIDGGPASGTSAGPLKTNQGAGRAGRKTKCAFAIAPRTIGDPGRSAPEAEPPPSSPQAAMSSTPAPMSATPRPRSLGRPTGRLSPARRRRAPPTKMRGNDWRRRHRGDSSCADGGTFLVPYSRRHGRQRHSRRFDCTLPLVRSCPTPTATDDIHSTGRRNGHGSTRGHDRPDHRCRVRTGPRARARFPREGADVVLVDIADQSSRGGSTAFSLTIEPA
jgi:hypothetical protein